MQLKFHKASQVYRFWRIKREKAGVGAFLTSSYAIICIYLEDRGPTYQNQIARDCALNQGNLASRYLPNLVKMGLIDWHSGGRPAGGGHEMKIYHVTDEGRKFLDLFEAYSRDMVERVMSTGPWFASGRARNVRPNNLTEVG